VRHRRPLAVLASLALILAGGLARPRAAQADPICPDIGYLGNYPQDEELNWSENIQGVAHDAGHWFFTNTDHLMKVPVDQDLSDGSGVDDDNPDWAHPTADLRQVPIPAPLASQGFNHYGDIDQIAGYILAPIEAQDEGKVVIAAFRASDLGLVSWVDVTAVQGDHGGWLAIDPVTHLVYASGNQISSDHPMTRYQLDLAALNQLDHDTVAPTDDLAGALSFYTEWFLQEADGSIVTIPFKQMQGGAFTPWGDLFIINGYFEGDPDEERWGIHLFDPYGKLITESTNGSGNFNFEFHVDDEEEPEGIDWWDRDDEDPAAPGIGGQLHVVMIDNTNFFSFEESPDDLYFKHYAVDYFCHAGADTDGDGLTDDYEVYELGTEPLVADTDGDGLNDGGEVTHGTDPFAPDTDGDGLSDGDEVNVHLTDPLLTDTDGDGLSDGDEVNVHGTSPLLADTDGDGLSDSDEINTHGTDPTVADTDGDGISDGDEVGLGTDPNDADGDDDGLNDGLEVAYGTNPLSPDSDGDGLLDGRDVEFVQNAVHGLPNAGFRPPGLGTKKAMLQDLDKTESLLLAGRKGKAIRNLMALREHVDGCGTSPDRNDWIISCPDQVTIRGLIDLLITNLMS
jgi:thrombospondin type 3 repeat protein